MLTEGTDLTPPLPVSRPYRPPVAYNPMGTGRPQPNGRVGTPPGQESPPLVDERTARKLCLVCKADFFVKDCGENTLQTAPTSFYEASYGFLA
jgi:hypothetical protein